MEHCAPALIEIANATVYRGNTKVFDGLSLKLPQAQNLAILGPNGAGKSTLLKLITRELYPVKDTGYVKILGQSRWVVAKLRREIGIVSDDLQLRYRRHITALNVVLSGYYSSIGIRRINARPTQSQIDKSLAALDQLGMAGFRDTPLAEMSTGQQRRCLLARALVHQPKTLVLDEPTAGLDLTGSVTYLNTIRRLTQERHNLVIVTHHVNEIPPEVSRVVLLKEGKIFADGDKRELLTSEKLSALYEVKVRVIESAGFFLAHPG